MRARARLGAARVPRDRDQYLDGAEPGPGLRSVEVLVAVAGDPCGAESGAGAHGPGSAPRSGSRSGFNSRLICSVRGLCRHLVQFCRKEHVRVR